MRREMVVILAALSAGCVQTQEMQLAKNVYRLDTEARGIASGSGQKETMKRAAQLTLQQGYTHFVLTDAYQGAKTETIGATPVTANRVGNQVFLSGGQPINTRVSNVGVTVIMYKAGENANAIDARQVLSGS